MLTSTRSATVILFFLVVSAPFLVLLSCFRSVAFDIRYYDEKFTEYAVYDNPRFAGINLLDETEFLLNYLKLGDGLIRTDFFNEKEKAHLEEVRSIFKTALSLRRFFFFFTLILLVSLSYVTPRDKFLNKISKYLLFSAVLIILLLALGGLALADFGPSFTRFHKLFFTGQWAFDPATNNLTAMFPEAFFYDAASDILKLSFIVSWIMLALGVLLYYGPLFSKYYKSFKTSK